MLNIIIAHCSVSPEGDVPTSVPVDTLYKFDAASEGEMFNFVVSRLEY